MSADRFVTAETLTERWPTLFPDTRRVYALAVDGVSLVFASGGGLLRPRSRRDVDRGRRAGASRAAGVGSRWPAATRHSERHMGATNWPDDVLTEPLRTAARWLRR